jgi:hypothetical protein
MRIFEGVIDVLVFGLRFCMRLYDIADILVGYLFRERIEQVENGSYRVIQLRDITEEGTINWDRLVRTELDSEKPTVFIQQGDILFRTKGAHHTAILVDRTEHQVTAPAFFYIIRAHADSVLPEFLAWYLNQAPARQYFSEYAAGTGIRHLTRKSLENLEVSIPAFDIQQKIVALNHLNQKEKQLVHAIQKKRQALMDVIMLNAAQGTLQLQGVSDVRRSQD